MKVLQLASTFGTVGGIQSFIARLSAQLCAAGHETAVLACEVADEKEAGARPCAVERIPGFTHPFAPADRSAEEEVLAYAARFAPEVILTHHVGNARLLLALNRICPTVEIVHTLLCAGGKLFRRADRACTQAVTPRCLLRWYTGPCGHARSPVAAGHAYAWTRRHLEALRALSAVAVGSAYMRDYLIGEGVPPERIALVDLTTGIPPEQTARTPPGPPYSLLYVGRLVYNKGVQHALRALARLDARYRLVVVGDGYYRPALERLARELRVDPRVEFTGFLRGDALAARFRQAAVAVVPSLVPEPTGLVVPEARAHGLPVVAYDVGGLGEWADRSPAVYLAAPACVEALADTMARAAAGLPPVPRAGHTAPREPVLHLLKRVAAEGGGEGEVAGRTSHVASEESRVESQKTERARGREGDGGVASRKSQVASEGTQNPTLSHDLRLTTHVSRLSVIVPAYQRPQDLCRCLQALQRQTRRADEALVVIRESDAATRCFLEGFDPGALPLRVLTVTVPGQVAALNAGLEAARGDLLAFTDDDAAPRPDWLERIEAAFQADAQTGGVGGRDLVHHAGFGLETEERAVVGMVGRYGRTIGNHHLGVGPPRAVDFLKGANMSFRRAAVGALRFDERLRGSGAQVFNDMAFCLAIRRKGWTLRYDPSLVVDHYEAPRYDEDRRGAFSAQAQRNLTHNETLILLEHLPPGRRAAFLLWSLLVGTRAAPGLAQTPRLLLLRLPAVLPRLAATLAGRATGLKSFLRRRKAAE